MKINSYKYDVIRQALQEIEHKIRVEVTAHHSFSDKDKPIVFGVNWSAHGTQTPDEASQYASNIIEASSIARRLTDYKFTVDYGMKIPETYDFTGDVGTVYEALLNIDNYTLTQFIEKEVTA